MGEFSLLIGAKHPQTFPLQHEILLRDIHRRDAAEIEELYRAFLFMDLPRREERARASERKAHS
jgi:hypothetical protein